MGTLPLFTLWPCLSARDECSYVTCCFFSRCVPGWQLTMHQSGLSLLLFFARAYAVLAHARLLLFSQLIPWLTTHHATVSSQLTVFVARAHCSPRTYSFFSKCFLGWHGTMDQRLFLEM